MEMEYSYCKYNIDISNKYILPIAHKKKNIIALVSNVTC